MTNRVRAEASRQQPGSVDLWIYGDIGPAWAGMIDAQAVAKALDPFPAPIPVNVHIASAGGDVIEGTAIYNLLTARQGGVTALIEGAALSAASLVAMGANRIRIAANALMMVHNPWTIAIGNADELVESAATLEKFQDSIARTYSARTKAAQEKVQAMMDATTWMTAEEATAAGFADEIMPLQIGAPADATADVVDSYRRRFAAAVPERIAALAHRPDAATQAQAAAPPAPTQNRVLEEHIAALTADLNAAKAEAKAALDGQVRLRAALDALAGEARALPASTPPREPGQPPATNRRDTATNVLMETIRLRR